MQHNIVEEICFRNMSQVSPKLLPAFTVYPHFIFGERRLSHIQEDNILMNIFAFFQSAYEYDDGSVKSSANVELHHYHETSLHLTQQEHQKQEKEKQSKTVVEVDPQMPPPPPDLTLAPTDILIIKQCGVTSVILAGVIFCAQVLISGTFQIKLSRQ